jgi:hypothetical protein
VLQELELQPQSRRDLHDRSTTHATGDALCRRADVVVGDHGTIIAGVRRVRNPPVGGAFIGEAG